MSAGPGASEATFWRAVVAACHELSTESSTEALLSLAATVMRDLASARSVSVFAHGPDSRLSLRAHAGEELGTVIAGDVVVSFPLLTDGQERGVVHVRGAVIDETSRPGLEAIATQLAIALGQAAVYEELESLVNREMATAVAREHAMQLVLDSMAEGLVVCDLEGRITSIRSKTIVDWFGEPSAGTSVWTYLGGTDAAFTRAFELAFQDMAADFLPFEVNAMHVPSLLCRQDRAYRFNCRQVMIDGVFAQVAITVTDVTEALASEKLARAARELPEVIGNLLRDRDGFKAMIADTERLLAELAVEEEPPVRARIIHTLKGNSGVWGFSSFAEACHQLEESFDGDARALREPQVRALADAWMDSLRPVRGFVDIEQNDEKTVLRVSGRDYGDALERLERREDHAIISAVLREWTRAPMRTPLETLARQAKRLADQLGKRVRVVVDADGRVPDLPLTSLVAELVHAVRNALAHGVEAPEERVASGKDPEALIRISATTVADVFELVLEDDGRGIDWSVVRARARELGLPCATDEDAHECLFADNLSTVKSATALAGRGVGMSAVRDAFRRLGGDVRVESTPGHGTRVVGRAPLTPCAVPLSHTRLVAA